MNDNAPHVDPEDFVSLLDCSRSNLLKPLFGTAAGVTLRSDGCHQISTVLDRKERSS